MGKKIFFFTLCFGITSLSVDLYSQCNNPDFETGDFTGWQGYTGYHPDYGSCCPTAGFAGGRHTIVTGAGNDPCGGFPQVYPGGVYSMKLGNNSVGAQAERVTMTFLVTSTTTSFTYSYAVVLEDPNHPASQQPYFEIRMTDQGGADIPCSYYYVAAGQGIPGFANSGICPGVVYKPWTTVNIDLTPYIGQTVTIQFTVADCSQTGHYGYAYIDASCVPYSIVQYDSLCNPGNPINVFAPAGAATYSWTPGGQSTSFIQVTNPGNYCVQMTSVQGCITNLCHQVSLYPGITANFTYAYQCSLIVDFTDATTGGTTSSWEWDFGDGSPLVYIPNPTHTFPSNNPYNVILRTETTNGCKDSVVIQVTPLFNPTASFTATTVCLNNSTSFTDLSSGGVMSQWDWNFGDPGSGGNNTSTLENPSHVFSTAGTFNVQLVAENTMGCVDTVVQQVTVNPLAAVDFLAPPVCFNDTTFFTNLSSVSTGSISSFSWNFGDPLSGPANTSSLQNPFHVFTSPITFTVTLTAVTDNNCTSGTSKQVTVFPLPVANFAAIDVCHYVTMNFIDQSSGSGLSWSWNFGDNGTSAQQNPGHLYAAPDTYTVRLAVQDINSCRDTVYDQVIVYPLPVADFITDSVCRYLANSFIDLSTIPYGSISLRRWNFGDGTPVSFLTNPTHVYANSGVYWATLIVFSDRNCTDTIIRPVVVHPLPVPSFSATDVCLNVVTQFTDLTIIESGTLAGWNWNFGDGNSSTLQNPAYTYANYGTYNVKLVVTSQFSCVDSVTQPVDVHPLPTSQFTFFNVCEYDSAQFTDLSTVPITTINQWNWDFGDATASSLQNPRHKYNNDGIYFVSLTVTTNFNCTGNMTDTIYIHPEPSASFTVLPVCMNDPSLFTDLSTVNPGAMASWYWNFGDGSSATMQFPSHTYSQYGDYTVTLIVTTDSGCTDTHIETAVVYPLPTAFFSVAPVCSLQTSLFIESSVSIDTLVSYQWDFGDNSGTSILPDPAYVYATDGLYPVTLQVTTDKGCMDTIIRNARVWPLPVVVFSGTPLSGCQPWEVLFTNGSYVPNSTVAAQTWYYGDGGISSAWDEAYTYFNYGIFDVKLVVTSAEGCIDSLRYNDYVVVYRKPIADFSTYPQPTTILWPTIYFTDLSDIPDFWYWEFGDGADTNAQNPVHVYMDTGWYNVRLTITTLDGCRDTAEKPLYIEPEFVFFIPNAFTPNNDGINDFFLGQGIGIRKYEMFIYDRWGDLIYRTNDLQKPWDGRANSGSKMAQIDTYVYLVNITDVNNVKHRYVGHVNLVK